MDEIRAGKLGAPQSLEELWAHNLLNERCEFLFNRKSPANRVYTWWSAGRYIVLSTIMVYTYFMHYMFHMYLSSPGSIEAFPFLQVTWVLSPMLYSSYRMRSINWSTIQRTKTPYSDLACWDRKKKPIRQFFILIILLNHFSVIRMKTTLNICGHLSSFFYPSRLHNQPGSNGRLNLDWALPS